MSKLKTAADIKVGDRLLGWAASEDVRSRGASGGLVTAVLAAALETGFVDSVLVLKRIGEFEAYPVFTSDVQEVLESAGSMHSVPVNLARYLKPETCPGKIALPAKPCDARAVVERTKRNVLSPGDTYIIGLNCGGTMHPETVRKMLDTVYRLGPEEIAGE
jgi:formate dehydrogenase subunit beta